VLYVVPPHTVMVCSPHGGVLCVVDTYAVPKRSGGNGKHGAVVTLMYTAMAIHTVQLFDRLCTEDTVMYKLAVLT